MKAEDIKYIILDCHSQIEQCEKGKINYKDDVDQVQALENIIKHYNFMIERLKKYVIEAKDVASVVYMENVKRQGSFGFEEREADTRNKDFILNSIKQGKEYKYFDRFGNKFEIDEILILP